MSGHFPDEEPGSDNEVDADPNSIRDCAEDAQEELLEYEHGYPEETPWWQCPLQLIAMVSNFSTSYNAVNVSLVIPILESLYKNESNEEDISLCASSLLAGMMVGQVLGGILGDTALGRLGALSLVMTFQVIASIGSALIFHENVFWALAIWRFVLGVGAGGVYPLAAVLSAEQANGSSASRVSGTDNEESMQINHDKTQKQMRRVVYTFSMQGVGFLAVPLVTVPLLHLCGSNNLEFVWRFILGFGSVPGLLLMILQVRLHRQRSVPHHEPIPLSEPTEQDDSDLVLGSQHDRDSPFMKNDHCSDAELSEAVSPESVVLEDNEPDTHHHGYWSSILQEPHLFQKLLGTAGTWFLFDVLFYGNTLFEPIVLEAAFGGSSDTVPSYLKGSTADNDLGVLIKAATDSLILSTIAMPGYIVSALIMGKRTYCVTQTPRFVQLQGFVAMGLLYAAIGAYWSHLKLVPWLLVFLYGMTFFFANYGPNTTTFTMPSLVYSPSCRSTLNGISAASGKAGALFGATLFSPAAEDLGDDRVMLICGAVSILAFVMTFCFVRLPSIGSPSIE